MLPLVIRCGFTSRAALGDLGAIRGVPYGFLRVRRAFCARLVEELHQGFGFMGHSLADNPARLVVNVCKCSAHAYQGTTDDAHTGTAIEAVLRVEGLRAKPLEVLVKCEISCHWLCNQTRIRPRIFRGSWVYSARISSLHRHHARGTGLDADVGDSATDLQGLLQRRGSGGVERE